MHSKQDFQNVRQILGPGLDFLEHSNVSIWSSSVQEEVILIQKMKEVKLVKNWVGRGVNDNRKHGPTNQKVSGCVLLSKNIVENSVNFFAVVSKNSKLILDYTKL